MATKRRKSVKASKKRKRRIKQPITAVKSQRKRGPNVKPKTSNTIKVSRRRKKAPAKPRLKKNISAKGFRRSPLKKSGIKRLKRRKGLPRPKKKKAASGRRVTTKKTGKIPKGWVEQKRLPGFKALQDELKALKKKLKISEKKLRGARVKRQVDLIRERNRKKRQNPRIIRALTGLGMAEQIKGIRQVLGTALDEKEYWKLVKQIADEMGITTYNVLLYMYVRD